MAIAVVQTSESTVQTSTLSHTVTGTVAGNSLLICARYKTGATFNGLTVSGETATLRLTGVNATLDTDFKWFTVDSLSSGGSKTIQYTITIGGAPETILNVWELSGCNTSGVYDNSAQFSGSSGTMSVNLTTGVANAAIFAWGHSNGGLPVYDSANGYTDQAVTNVGWYNRAQRKLDVGAAGSKTVQFTVAGDQQHIMAISLKPASGSITGTMGPTEASDTAAMSGSRGLTVTVTLVDATGTPRANLTGLKWAWWDQATPNILTAPTDKGGGETTDASGAFTITLENSALAPGGIGMLGISDTSGTVTACNSFFAPVAVS